MASVRTRVRVSVGASVRVVVLKDGDINTYQLGTQEVNMCTCEV